MKKEPGASPLEIAVSLQDAAWGEMLENPTSLAETAIRATLSRLDAVGSPGAALEVSLLFADDAAVAELNQSYRGRSGPTNVLSFPNMDPARSPADDDNLRPRLLGDVVLARQTIAREAAEQDKSLQNHTLHLIIHGLLHLLGYDHESEAEAEEMEAIEVAVLADLGIGDPYRRRAGGFAEATGAPAPGPATHGRS